MKPNAREIVVLIRELRDGTLTEERLERWLAELVIGCIPAEEPNVARARIMDAPALEPVKIGRRTNWAIAQTMAVSAQMAGKPHDFPTLSRSAAAGIVH